MMLQKRKIAHRWQVTNLALYAIKNTTPYAIHIHRQNTALAYRSMDFLTSCFVKILPQNQQHVNTCFLKTLLIFCERPWHTRCEIFCIKCSITQCCRVSCITLLTFCDSNTALWHTSAWIVHQTCGQVKVCIAALSDIYVYIYIYDQCLNWCEKAVQLWRQCTLLCLRKHWLT